MKYMTKDDPDKEDWEKIDDGMHTLDHRNVIALNLLIRELQKSFEVEIIISSAWRLTMENVMEKFREHSVLLTTNEEFRKTKYDGKECGLQILDFCKENNIDVKDIIAIDDDVADISPHLPWENILHTNYNFGLTFIDVDSFLITEKLK